MEYRRLGNAGLKVSAIGLGGSTFGRQCDAEQTARVIGRAVDLGVNCIDTADEYAGGRSEEYIGKALRAKRRDVVIATKVRARTGDGPNDEGLSRVHILRAIEDSLRRLGTDYVDVYQCHAPDRDTPLEETLRALDDVVRQGKVRYIGCSNVAAWQVCEALWVSDRHGLHRFVSVQPRYNLLDRTIERELLPFCRAHGVGILPYHPLAAGLLTGKYRPGEAPPAGTRFARAPQLQSQLTDESLAAVARLERWAHDHDHTVGELAIAWLLSHPEVSSVIAGATGLEQVEANIRAGEWRLTAAEAQEVEQLI